LVLGFDANASAHFSEGCLDTPAPDKQSDCLNRVGFQLSGGHNQRLGFSFGVS